jgi:hypothetical protein
LCWNRIFARTCQFGCTDKHVDVENWPKILILSTVCGQTSFDKFLRQIIWHRSLRVGNFKAFNSCFKLAVKSWVERIQSHLQSDGPSPFPLGRPLHTWAKVTRQPNLTIKDSLLDVKRLTRYCSHRICCWPTRTGQLGSRLTEAEQTLQGEQWIWFHGQQHT